MRNSSLFLAHPTYWNKCMTSENAQCSSRSGFQIFKISREIRVLKQSQSAFVWQYYPHDNIVYIHMYDEYMKSIDSGVCHRPWSILQSIAQAYSLTIEYLVVQFLPSFSISEQVESMHLTILQQISFLLL